MTIDSFAPPTSYADAPGPHRRSPGQRATLLFSLLLLFALVVGGAWFLVVRVLGQENLDVRAQTSVAGSTAVRINGSNSAMSVSPSTDGLLHVHATGHYAGSVPQVSARTSDGQTLVDINCPGGLLNWCDVDAAIELPAGLPLTVLTDNGDITSAGISANLTLTSDNGDLEISGGGPVITATSHNGDVTVRNSSTGIVTATTDNGDVDLQLSSAPDSVVARSDNGDIDVTVSGEAKYLVDADSDNGAVKVDVGIDTDSAHRITATTANGDVRVRPLS